MKPKPKYLGSEYSAPYKDRSVLEAYRYRAPYPPETFEILAELITDEPRVVLDVGCGTGEVARYILDFVDRVDAVDFSHHMIEEGKRLPKGNHPRLRWILGRAEEVVLNPPYALVTAGVSLHWMEWDVVLPRFRKALVPQGLLAIVDNVFPSAPWENERRKITRRYSTHPDYEPYDLIEELVRRGLFKKQGEKQTAPVLFTQSVDEYIEFLHSRSDLSRERMGKETSGAFDKEIKDLLTQSSKEGIFEWQIRGKVIWGLPLSL